MQIIPMRDLKDTVSIERICKEENGPVFITKNGYGRLVVMDIEYFEKLMRQLFEAKQIAEGMKDVEKGNVVDSDDVIKIMKEKYGF